MHPKSRRIDLYCFLHTLSVLKPKFLLLNTFTFRYIYYLERFLPNRFPICSKMDYVSFAEVLAWCDFEVALAWIKMEQFSIE